MRKLEHQKLHSMCSIREELYLEVIERTLLSVGWGVNLKYAVVEDCVN